MQRGQSLPIEDPPVRGDDAIAALIAPVLEGMGYSLVRVQQSGGRRPTLQVMAERRDGRAMTVEDCATISRVLSAKLDVDDPIAGPYNLEVSSPGIDRPLTRLADFERFAGALARIETRAPIDGRRRFTGRILGVDGDNVRVRIETGDVTIGFPAIGRAKLVLTDELIAAAQSRSDTTH